MTWDGSIALTSDGSRALLDDGSLDNCGRCECPPGETWPPGPPCPNPTTLYVEIQATPCSWGTQCGISPEYYWETAPSFARYTVTPGVTSYFPINGTLARVYDCSGYIMRYHFTRVYVNASYYSSGCSVNIILWDQWTSAYDWASVAQFSKAFSGDCVGVLASSSVAWWNCGYWFTDSFWHHESVVAFKPVTVTLHLNPLP